MLPIVGRHLAAGLRAMQARRKSRGSAGPLPGLYPCLSVRVNMVLLNGTAHLFLTSVASNLSEDHVASLSVVIHRVLCNRAAEPSHSMVKGKPHPKVPIGDRAEPPVASWRPYDAPGFGYCSAEDRYVLSTCFTAAAKWAGLEEALSRDRSAR